MSIYNVTMTLGQKDNAVTCNTTWSNQISTAVGPLCQGMPWHHSPLQISWCSAGFYIVNLGLKCRKLRWHTSQQTPKCSHAVCTPQSLESDQSDTAICASVKVSDYYTVDSSSWICVQLTTVGSNPDSLNQNKHLGSIIPCWKPLIVNSQSTLSRAGLSTELYINALF